MITEDYVSFETAKLLKEKGFDEPCRASYYKNQINDSFTITNNVLNKLSYAAPTLQMAMKWLREVHNLNIGILFGRLRDFKTHWNFYIEDIKLGRESLFFHTYEEACEAAIKYCLENLV
jgi:hypothetical protein